MSPNFLRANEKESDTVSRNSGNVGFFRKKRLRNQTDMLLYNSITILDFENNRKINDVIQSVLFQLCFFIRIWRMLIFRIHYVPATGILLFSKCGGRCRSSQAKKTYQKTQLKTLITLDKIIVVTSNLEYTLLMSKERRRTMKTTICRAFLINKE